MRLKLGKVLRTAAAVLLLETATAWPQVTTATFYGIVNDPSGAAIPGATVTMTHEGTRAATTKVADEKGEFVFNFLPVGAYTLRIEATGFKTFESKSMELLAAQNIRRAFTLEVGQVAETVTVTGETSLVNTVSPEQRESFSRQQVTELPLARRNFANILSLGTGVTRGGSGQVRFNGVGRSGTRVSVDGTDASSNPEAPGTSMYQSFNYIDIMSIEAVQEVQTTKGIIPAEYAYVLTGNVNLISKSGTNTWHGSLFENYIGAALNARTQTAATKPGLTFNQFGGSLGGPIRKDRVFVFGAYEGYREASFLVVQGNVPTVRLRDAMARAVPDYKAFLDTVPAPNQPHDPNGIIGRFIGAGSQRRDDNHAVVKTDILLFGRSTLAGTYARGRPNRIQPRVSPINFRQWEGVQERGSVSFITGGSNWTSETRWGYNHNNMFRVDGFFGVKDPKNANEQAFGGRRLPEIGGLGIGNGGGENIQLGGPTWTLEHKYARVLGRHSLKLGGIYSSRGGGRSDVENPSVSFANEADLLANIPSAVTATFGVNPYTSHSFEIGFFVQDDWRATSKLVLNLGVRYDYFSIFVAKPSTQAPAGLYNLDGLRDARNFIFGPLRSADEPFNPDPVNLGPRFGFAFNPDGKGQSVVRGGFGVMFSPITWATFNNAVGNTPTLPFRRSFSRAEAAQFGLRYPVYNDDMAKLVQGLGRISIADLFDPNLDAPYTMNIYLGVQRALSSSLALESAFVGNRGVKFFMYRRFNQVDRVTGQRPNADLGFEGNYLDSSQQVFYSSWQTSLRKRYSQSLSFDVHYTWGKSLSYTGGDNAATFNDDADANIQDFFNVKANRGPSIGDRTHVISADWIYDLPRLAAANPWLRQAIGGWQVSGIVRANTGEAFSVTQRSPGGPPSRPDVVDFNRAVLSDYRRTLQYLDPAAFVRVPLSASRIPIRPGNAGSRAFRAPGAWTVDFSFGKNFGLTEKLRFQIRADLFNALNHTNLGGPVTDLDDPNFGRIFGTGGARTIQVNARLSF